MEDKADFLKRIYGVAKAHRLVLTMEEYAGRLEMSRAKLYRILKNPDEIEHETINKARQIERS